MIRQNIKIDKYFTEDNLDKGLTLKTVKFKFNLKRIKR